MNVSKIQYFSYSMVLKAIYLSFSVFSNPEMVGRRGVTNVDARKAILVQDQPISMDL